jgi:hypothetical protein
VTIQVKNHLPALRLRQAGDWTRIHTNEGEGIETPVSDQARGRDTQPGFSKHAQSESKVQK